MSRALTEAPVPAVDPVWLRWREDAISETSSAKAREYQRKPLKVWPLCLGVQFGADVLWGFADHGGIITAWSAEMYELCDPPRDVT